MMAALTERAEERVRCVIYDCDGVMFDSLEANGKLYNHLASSVGRDPLTEEELRYCHTHTVFQAIHRLFDADPEREQAALVFLKTMDLKEFIGYLVMEPYLVETLMELKGRGIKTAVCTNRTTTMKAIVERFGLAACFDMVVTALDVQRPKPDPESVDMILSALRVEREAAVYIGDSEVDRETARSSGVRFVAYKNSELRADAAIDDHRSILNLLWADVSPR